MGILSDEAHIWSETRHGRVSPVIVFSRLGPITLLTGGFVKLVAGREPPTPFTLFTPTAVAWWAAGFILPTLVVALLARFLDGNAWRAFGPVLEFDDSTCEVPQRGAFVIYPMSCYSSNILTAMGSLILAHAVHNTARAPIASAALGSAYFALGVASFGWWGSRRRVFHQLDNWLMETHLYAVGVCLLSAGLPEHEPMMVAAWAAYAAYRLATFPEHGHGDLLWSSVLYWVGALVSLVRTGGSGEVWRFVLATGGVHSGLILKMYDTTGRGPWGTAAFHYSCSVGWTFWWAWSQSLPSIPK